MYEDQFWLLVSLKLSEEATEEDLASLEVWLNKFPERRAQLDTLQSLWKERTPIQTPDMLSRHLQRMSEQTAAPSPIPRKSYRFMLAVAATVVIAVVSIYLLTVKKNKSENMVMTKPGSKSKVILPDGSQVWLNADSKLTYGKDNRDVTLSGEAYFDIARDKDHPFIIHAGSIEVKVLGTILNVRSYSNEPAEAVLISGSIEVSLRNNPDRKIILKPNQKIEHPFKAPEMLLTKAHFKQEDSTATEILWTKNKLAFDQESLEDVAAKIERWYNVKVTIADESLKKTEYSGVFEDESLEQVMEALRLTGDFKYSINKKEITITR
ncbi:MAG: DUF4974 domain-containing protein [Bacteroidetes bacterium]|nr:DUF4974 domain-containing protein [Bacteroidota bacterium]